MSIKTYATLRIRKEELDLDVIFTRLGLNPTRLVRKGEPWRPNDPVISEIGVWHYSSKNLFANGEPEDHINFILSKIDNKSEDIHALQKDMYDISISCYWQSDSGSGVIVLGSETVEKLAKFGVRLWFDIYLDREEH